ncbi:MAG: putative acetyltransferase [Candidatus Azotimanducaceae bacterium]|jgi:putative acetyltransferase
MQIRRIRALTDDIDSLLQQSRDYQNELYPPESVHQDDTASLLSEQVYFIGAFQKSHQNELLLGIGAVKFIDVLPAYGEIKNLFVPPEHRGKGAAKIIMSALEARLKDQGANICRLETGPSQLESIGLYQRLGYQQCSLYGNYQPDPLSLFMEKELLD